jgi:hypothetical protein
LELTHEGAMHVRLGVVAALAVAVGAPALAETDDGFAAFWSSFQAAAAKDDARALASMIALGPNLGEDGASFARFHAGELGPKVRRCLAKAKPDRDVNPEGSVLYSAYCGGEIIYGFTKTGGVWKLTELSAND